MTPLEAALNAIDSQTADPLIAAKCRGLMFGYDRQWTTAPYQIDGAETLIQSYLWNPATQRKSRTFTVAGKTDATASYNGKRVLFDHKTTSDDINDPNSTYWRQLRIEGQASLYMLLEWLNGRKVDECVWDVVRKPSIRPRRITKEEVKDMRSMKIWFGWAVTQDEIDEAMVDGSETPRLYSLRLAHDCAIERPFWYFARRPVPRLDEELAEYAAELWRHGQDILYERNKQKLPVRNSGACMMYGRPCQFLGVCSGYDTADSANWQRKQQVHVELPLNGTDGREVLTNSRIRCFQTCRRKHYYQYELGIERVDSEDAEALAFGSLWHHGLEAWFLAIKKEQENTNGSRAVTGSSVNGIDAAADEEAVPCGCDGQGQRTTEPIHPSCG